MSPYPPAKPVAKMSDHELGELLDRFKPSQLRILAKTFAGLSPAGFDAAAAEAARITPPENFAVAVNRL